MLTVARYLTLLTIGLSVLVGGTPWRQTLALEGACGARSACCCEIEAAGCCEGPAARSYLEAGCGCGDAEQGHVELRGLRWLPVHPAVELGDPAGHERGPERAERAWTSRAPAPRPRPRRVHEA